MILIADSGGSKIDWRMLSRDGTIAQAHCAGFNPYYQPVADLKRNIEDALLPSIKEEVTKIFYYGAGLSSDKNMKVIETAFADYFPKATIEVGWDLLAAARALCGDEAGIACILGTGSNSCLYDGKVITGNVANLGWILADEASGTHLGKQLIFDYFRENMPKALAEQFHARFPSTREEVLERVYQHERPSAYLASFSRFIFQHLKEPYCYQLVYRSFSDFYENNVMKYPNYANLKVHFTGSISFYFSDVLRQVASDKGISVKNILEGPIAGLALFHKKDLN
jgi:glucosamine kinase